LTDEQQDQEQQIAKDDDLIKTHIDAEGAARRFRDATEVTSKGVDFTTAIHRRRKDKQSFYPRTAATLETNTYLLGSGTGYRSANDGTGDDGDLEKDDNWIRIRGTESMVDRFRRLRFETEELEKDLQINRGSTKEGEIEDGEDAGPGQNELLPQLQFLREQLEGIQHIGQLSAMAQKTDTGKWQSQTKRLLAKLGEVQSNGQVRAGAAEAAGAANDAEISNESAHKRELDGRLVVLEALIGVESASQDEAKSLPRPLLPALARIEHLLTLLTQPRHLDGISRRLKVLVSELERAHEARRRLTVANVGNAEDEGEGEGEGGKSALMSKETVVRLSTALPLLARIEPMLPIIPALLNRLQSLSSLHTSSAAIASDVEAMEGILRSSASQNQDMTEMLASLEKTLIENEQRSKDNLSSIQERMEKVFQRMDALMG
jgi:nuclear migration protein JNM1